MRTAGFFHLAALFCACAPDPAPPRAPAPAPRAAALMIESGYRLQVLGRAATAGHWALAAHESKRLRTLFGQDLPNARLPEDAVVEVLMARSRSFVQRSLPPLDAAVAAHDPARFAASYRAVVDACNECHAASGFELIVIPTEPGAPFPRTDPPAGVPLPP